MFLCFYLFDNNETGSAIWLLVNVVVELIVAAEGDQSSYTESVREEHLGHGIDPDLRERQ